MGKYLLKHYAVNDGQLTGGYVGSFDNYNTARDKSEELFKLSQNKEDIEFYSMLDWIDYSAEIAENAPLGEMVYAKRLFDPDNVEIAFATITKTE